MTQHWAEQSKENALCTKKKSLLLSFKKNNWGRYVEKKWTINISTCTTPNYKLYKDIIFPHVFDSYYLARVNYYQLFMLDVWR